MTPPAPLAAADAAARALDALRGSEPAVGVVVVAGEQVGSRMVVWAGHHAGTLSKVEWDRCALELAREVLAGGKPGVREVKQAGASFTLYLEVYRPPPELIIVGAGHIARPLCRVGAMLGFRVTVLDDRPEFALPERFPEATDVLRADLFAAPFREVALGAETHLVLVTRGHKYDYRALLDALRAPVPLPYIGMVGSQRRTRAALEQLVRDGVPLERLAGIHSPVGLDIGAETPEEIAVSVAAELVRVRRGGSGASLRDRARVVERWIRRDGDVLPDEPPE
jgi:xanthine dehydrogenase accessory factor